MYSTSPFRKRLHWKARHQAALVPHIEAAMRQLQASDEPEKLGRMKHGELAGVYGYDLPRFSRLLYSVDRTSQPTRVVLLRVCSHKQVYG